jgi:uncharacterized membrane protein
MELNRIWRHLKMTPGRVTGAMPRTALMAIERAIKNSEAVNPGEIRFVIEGALGIMALLRSKSANARALELFSLLRVWDTHENNGLLIYVLLADQAVEIVTDRGINTKVGTANWDKVCRQMEAAFGKSNYEGGAVNGVHAAGRLLAEHFPAGANRWNDLADAPMLI